MYSLFSHSTCSVQVAEGAGWEWLILIGHIDGQVIWWMVWIQGQFVISRIMMSPCCHSLKLISSLSFFFPFLFVFPPFYYSPSLPSVCLFPNPTQPPPATNPWPSDLWTPHPMMTWPLPACWSVLWYAKQQISPPWLGFLLSVEAQLGTTWRMDPL